MKKFIKSIGKFSTNLLAWLSVNKYYLMDNKQLELEASKYHIGNYVDGFGVDRERIIEQLLKKDQANDSRIAIFIALLSLIFSVLSFFISYKSLFVINEQTSLQRSDLLPILSIQESKEKDEEGKYADSIINVFNLGKPLHNFNIETYVFIKADNKILYNYRRINYSGYYLSTIRNSSGNKIMSIRGVKNNYLLFNNLSKDFHNKYNSYLSREIYFKVEYIDSLQKKHTEYYKLDTFEGRRISNEEGKNVTDEYQHGESVDVEETNSEVIYDFFKDEVKNYMYNQLKTLQ